jgi:hypothetical protein
MPSRVRTRSVTAHLTPDEHSLIIQSAASYGCSPGEYARRQLLASAKLPAEARFLAAELLAFQETFLALILASLRAEPLNESRVSELRARFAGIKSALVDQAIEQFRSTHSGDL